MVLIERNDLRRIDAKECDVTPSEIRLFTPKEQTLLVSTEPQRLAGLSEDELADLLGPMRRLRNKYSDLYRKQSGASIKAAGKRSAAETSNVRTLRKSEVAEDAVARVAHHLSRAARRSANDLKAERLAAARKAAPVGEAATPASGKPSAASSAKSSKPKVSRARVGSTTASTKRNQAVSDKR